MHHPAKVLPRNVRRWAEQVAAELGSQVPATVGYVEEGRLPCLFIFFCDEWVRTELVTSHTLSWWIVRASSHAIFSNVLFFASRLSKSYFFTILLDQWNFGRNKSWLGFGFFRESRIVPGSCKGLCTRTGDYSERKFSSTLHYPSTPQGWDPLLVKSPFFTVQRE
jgi:hypothetical protein